MPGKEKKIPKEGGRPRKRGKEGKEETSTIISLDKEEGKT